MPLEFFVTDRLATTNGVKCLIYGPAGAGKTRVLATAPAPFIFSCENGLLSLRQYSIPGVRIQSYKDMQDAFRWATSSAEARQFLTWCLDSSSDIAEKVLYNLLGKTKDNRQAYGEMASEMLDLFKGFRDLPGKNVVFTAKSQINIDPGTGGRLTRPMFPGQRLAEDVPYVFDEVFYMGNTVGADGRSVEYLQTFNDGRVYGKDRSGALAQYEQPNLSHIFSKITGAQKHGGN